MIHPKLVGNIKRPNIPLLKDRWENGITYKQFTENSIRVYDDNSQDFDHKI